MARKPMTEPGYRALVAQRAVLTAEICNCRETKSGHVGRMMNPGSSNELDELLRSESITASQLGLVTQMLQFAEPMPQPESAERIRLGNGCKLERDCVVNDYILVGEHEPDCAWPGLKMVSIVSPLGKRLAGKKVGDEISLGNAPSAKPYLVIDIWVPDLPTANGQAELPLEMSELVPTN
ncbi:MAG: GreA/GreB family elongation factor [Patescibacteria group bacterium]